MCVCEMYYSFPYLFILRKCTYLLRICTLKKKRGKKDLPMGGFETFLYTWVSSNVCCIEMFCNNWISSQNALFHNESLIIGHMIFPTLLSVTWRLPSNFPSVSTFSPFLWNSMYNFLQKCLYTWFFSSMWKPNHKVYFNCSDFVWVLALFPLTSHDL